MAILSKIPDYSRTPPERTIANEHKLLPLFWMNAMILLRIMPDLPAKYSLVVDGERLGDMETLNDAIVARECLKSHDFTFAEARAILEA
jgi:hypothetical protein